ncbi:MAG: phosphonoacetaldehyde hydrolase [Alphaproteobacteria bacterium]|nr:phosphonoacetaldehyde hydrolase [Alphaproteobacteria bacterium]
MWRNQRVFGGPVRAVILDWAGTAVDHGSCAPAGVFVRAFANAGVTVSMAAARRPMGVAKREHVRQMCADPEVAAAWQTAHGRPSTVTDEDALYADAAALQIACLPDFADPIAGVPEVVEALRRRGVRVAGTTGYTREMLDVLAEAAAARGYAPEMRVGASEVVEGRPAPFMIFEAMSRLGVWPVQAVVKAGDTPVDIEAGLNAGVWTVGVALTGNMVGLNAPELAALSDDQRADRLRVARQQLLDAGAHYVVDGVRDLLPVIDDIEARLARGERP